MFPGQNTKISVNETVLLHCISPAGQKGQENANKQTLKTDIKQSNTPVQTYLCLVTINQ